MPCVDIIIPNWNGRALLEPCLRSLEAQTSRDFKIIVVDNGSTDGSVELIQAEFAEVQLVKLDQNQGFSGAINAGLRAGSSEYVCWFNNDAEADPAFLEALLEALKAGESEGFAMAAARVVFHSSPHIINSAGLFVGPDGVGRDRGYQQKDGAFFDKAVEVFGPAGVAALYRREIFEQVGELDEDFFLYSEDLDLNYRAQLAGYRCLYVPGARVRHHGSATAGKISQKTAYLASRNGLLAIIKNWPITLFWRNLPWIFIGQIYQLILFARHGRLIPAVQGKFAAIKLLPATMAKRKIIQKQRRVTIAHFSRQLKLGRTTPRLIRRLTTGWPKALND